jgi:hypothetical protein
MTTKVKVPRGTARKLRRAAGDFAPVNPTASLEQAPEGKYARANVKAR